jgi:tetratricopeptide (TPR) repeat protein
VERLEEAAELLGPGDSALRAQVLSRLTVALYYVPGACDRRIALSREALEIARGAGDPTTLGLALLGRHWALWDPDHLEERLAVATELVRLAERIGAREMTLQGRAWRVGMLLERGEIEAVDGEIEAYARLAAEVRQPAYQWWTPMFRAMRANLDGRFADAERLAQEGFAVGQQVQNRVAFAIYGSHLIFLRRVQGRLGELEAVMRGLVEQFPDVVGLRSPLAYVLGEVGRRDEARREFETLAADDFGALDRDLRWMPSICLAAQVCRRLGDAGRAAVLHDLLIPYAGRAVVNASGAGNCMGAVSHYLGLLCTTLGRWEEAERHFEDALGLNTRMRARPWIAHTRCEHGAMLLARGRPEDGARARALLAGALDHARELGMAGLLERIPALQTEFGVPGGFAPEPARPGECVGWRGRQWDDRRRRWPPRIASTATASTGPCSMATPCAA